jgi:hypothetical protein
MHGYQWIEEVGEVDAWFTLAIEQYAVKVSVSILIG